MTVLVAVVGGLSVLVVLVLAALALAGHQVGVMDDPDVTADDVLVEALRAGQMPDLDGADPLLLWLAVLRDTARDLTR